MASVKMTLRVPTVGKKRGDVIEVADQETADALVANGSAAPFVEEVEPAKKSSKKD